MLTYGENSLFLLIMVQIFSLTIANDFSRTTWTFLMKNNTQVFDLLKNFITMIEVQYDIKVKIMPNDGSKFKSS